MVELIDRVQLLKWIDVQDGIYSVATNDIINHVKIMKMHPPTKELEERVEELESMLGEDE